MDSVHHIWCPLSSQEYQDLPDGAETTLTLEGQQSNNITLIDVLEGVHVYLEGHLDDFEIPEAFVTKEVPLKLAQLRERWERYVVLNAEWAARGRRGFERNPRDD